MEGRAKLKDEEWLPALDAAALVARRFNGLTNAKHALAIGLREDMLSAIAVACTAWEGDAPEPQEYEAIGDKWLEVPGELFSRSEAWDSDRLGWDWDDGLFDVHTEDSSYAFADVHFLNSEVLAIDPEAEPYRTASTERAPVRVQREAIRRRLSLAARKWEWEPAFADLIAIADDPDGLEGELGPLKRGFQGKLEGWFFTWFDERLKEAPGEDQRRTHARMIVQALERRRTLKRSR